MSIYDKYLFHPILDMTMKQTMEVRRRLLEGIRGDVLEVGIGAGTNLPLYQGRLASLSAVEPDDALSAECLKRAHALSLPIASMRRELSSMESASFDAAVVTFVLCSVESVPDMLAELRRVLRPGGVLYLLEHVESRGAQRVVQRVLRPLWRRAFGNCDLCLNLGHHLERAGFSDGLTPLKLEMPWPVSSGVMGRLSIKG